MTFREYQQQAMQSDRTGSDEVKSIMIPLLGLASEAGSLLSEYKKWLREGEAYSPFKDQVSEEIGDILWYLAALASKLNLDLDDIANENLGKLSERWPSPSDRGPLLFPATGSSYDAAYKPEERLPSHLRIDFVEEVVAGQAKLILRQNGEQIGDDLTDNSHVDDGYRYHDVFHLACGVLLGWSPVMRRIFKCKRKSARSIDEVEDGARALVTEEGVSAVVFAYASDHSMLEDASSVDYELLRTIKVMVRPFEVRTRLYHEWERTILASFRIWRLMMAKRGGTFIGDAVTGELHYQPPTW